MPYNSKFLCILISFDGTLITISFDFQSQAKEGVLGKDDDGRERRHTGGNASIGNAPQPGQTTPGATCGNKLLRQNSQNSLTQQNALSKSNKGCAQDQTSNHQGNFNQSILKYILKGFKQHFKSK